jgi:hypothetical protein
VRWALVAVHSSDRLELDGLVNQTFSCESHVLRCHACRAEEAYRPVRAKQCSFQYGASYIRLRMTVSTKYYYRSQSSCWIVASRMTCLGVLSMYRGRAANGSVGHVLGCRSRDATQPQVISPALHPAIIECCRIYIRALSLLTYLP